MIYVFSDVHAHTELYYKVKDTLNKDDEIYIIGDVIDKGDGSLDVMLDVMSDDRVHLLMGNHELMMWQYLNSIEKNREWASYDYGYRWKSLNDGRRTFEAYEELSEDKQKEVYEFLFSLPLQLSISVNGNNFVLVHAVPSEDGGDVYFKDCCKELRDLMNEADRYVWDRLSYYTVEDSIVLTGHSIVQYTFPDRETWEYKQIAETDGEYHEENGVWICDKPGNWYDIDLGLAANADFSKLAVVCLDDLSIRYFQ